MTTLKKGAKPRVALDQIDESSNESFPASDPPSWAGWETQSITTPPLSSEDPFTLLKEEHQHIMAVIYKLHEEVERLEQNQPLKTEPLKKIFDFLTQFAQKGHCEREIKHLFPALLKNKQSPSLTAGLEALQKDHEESQLQLALLERLLPFCQKNEASTREKLIETLNALKDLYTRHMLKEENLIFPLAKEQLSETLQKTLWREFHKSIE